MISEEILSIERWLQSKQVTLWANWDITQPDSLRKAAIWFNEQRNQLWVHEYEDQQARLGAAGFDVV
jgi:hypothetical protein